MKIEEKNNTDTNWLKLWCGECPKTLFLEDYGLEPLVPGMIELLESMGTRHEQKHPKHKPVLMIFNRRPTNAELRGSKRR